MAGRTSRIAAVAALLVLAMVTVGCGGGSPTSPSNGGGSGSGGGTGSGGGSGGGGSVSTTTITINASGVVTPNDITVSPGTRVTFVNNHNRNHDMSSDPHPTHEDCPEINAVGFLQPNQSKLTGNLNTVRVCGFHDHDNPTNANLRGQIRIQ